jgi:sugar lactone lactonase YvrE
MKTYIKNLFLLPALLAIATGLASILTPISAHADILYVAGFGNNNQRIEKFDLATGADLGVFANSYSYGSGLAFDSAGNLYAAGGFTTSILKITPGGVESVFASNVGASGLAFDSAGNLYAAIYGNGTIKKFTPGGVGSLFAIANPHVSGLAFDSASNLYAASFDSTQIEEFTPGGVRSVFANRASTGGAGLAFDSAGNLYAANQFNNTIEEFTPGGIRSVFANTGLSAPYGLAFDSAGNLYVANYGNNTIEKFSSTGTDLGIFASGLGDNTTWIAIQAVRPVLTIASVGNQSVLFWPASGTNYILQSTTNLASPNWLTASDAVPVIAFTVTNTSPARFFRLQQQQ